MRRGTVLGVSVAQGAVRAILAAGDRIDWIGSSTWSAPDDLSDAIARLAGEAGRVVRRARVVLERDLMQTRTITPAPHLRARAARQFVALEAPRLFRKNGAPLVTDGAILHTDGSSLALWSAAAPEPVVQAILDGCEQAGIAVEHVGPAADVLPRTTVTPLPGELIFPNGGTAEVISVGRDGTWRSRLVATRDTAEIQLVPSLVALGTEATHFAAAYGATVTSPRLSLLPEHAAAKRAHAARRQLIRLVVLAAVLWLIAFVTYSARLEIATRTAQRELDSNRAPLDSALALHRQLDAGAASLSEFANLTASRSRHLSLIAGLTSALGDSCYLVTLEIGPGGIVRIAGYAPSAVRVLASLGHVPLLRDARLEGPVTRERTTAGLELDRFAIVAQRDAP